MGFNPAKSRSLVLKKGKVIDRFRFRLRDHQIPSDTEKPVKSLGKVFSYSLKDVGGLGVCQWRWTVGGLQAIPSKLLHQEMYVKALCIYI